MQLGRVRLRDKFRHDRSSRCWDAAIFRFRKLQTSATGDFPKMQISMADNIKRASFMRPLANFVMIKQTVSSSSFTLRYFFISLYVFPI